MRVNTKRIKLLLWGVVSILSLSLLLYIKGDILGLIPRLPHMAEYTFGFPERKLVYVPQNLEECCIELEKILSSDQLEKFKNIPERKISGDYHMGLGMWIRNNWELWHDSRLARYFKKEMGIFHPDDMSGIILVSFHRYLNGKDLELSGQVRIYQQFQKFIQKYLVKVKDEQKATEDKDEGDTKILEIDVNDLLREFASELEKGVQ